MNFKKIDTTLGIVFIDYESSESELTLFDSNQKEIATLDKNETTKIVETLWNLKTPYDFYSLSFSKDISEEPNKEDQERFTIGNKNFYIIY